MSHFTTILTQIRDVDALGAACAELGVELLRDTDACELSTDWWNGHFERGVGPD